MSPRAAARPSDPLPRYGLYGEAADFAALEPLHIETIRARSGSNEWTILPHRHADLHQLMLITEGGGTFLIEGREIEVRAPRLVSVPASAAHGFSWAGETDGYNLMLSGPLLRSIPQTAALGAPFDAEPTLADTVAFQGLFATFYGHDPGRTLAMDGYVRVILAGFIQAQAGRHNPRRAPVPATDLAARYRDLIERDFARQPSISEACKSLGVTASRLTRACVTSTGTPPIALLHERLMLEARRLLAYSTMSVSEIGYALGFSETAYFSRFFRKREGASPNRWRRRHRIAS